MMNFLGTILGLLSIVVFIWACVGLFAPARAKLSSRWQSVLVCRRTQPPCARSKVLYPG